MPFKIKSYLVIFLIGIIVLILPPLLFYVPKLTKNPPVFDPVTARYMTIEVMTTFMTPQDIALIHSGDIQKDDNGEETARIISVLGVEHGVVGTALLENGKRIRIISEKRAVKLLLRIRYNNIEKIMTIHPMNTELIVGTRMSLLFNDPADTRRYNLNVGITRVEIPNDKGH